MAREKFAIMIDGESTVIGSSAELVVALDVLQGHHDREVLMQLGDQLPRVIGDARGLYAVLKALAPEDHLFFLELLGTRIRDLVNQASSLRDLLAMLSVPEVEQSLINLLGAGRLRELVQTPEELKGLLEWVYGDGDSLVLQLLGSEFLINLFSSGAELGLVLTGLDRIGQQQLLETMGADRVRNLTRDRRDLAYLLRALPPRLSLDYLRTFGPGELCQIIRSEHGWEKLRRVLEPEEELFLRTIWEAKNA